VNCDREIRWAFRAVFFLKYFKKLVTSLKLLQIACECSPIGGIARIAERWERAKNMRNRVLSAAKEVSYRPNAIPRGLI
jgi:hypothetical protein